MNILYFSSFFKKNISQTKIPLLLWDPPSYTVTMSSSLPPTYFVLVLDYSSSYPSILAHLHLMGYSLTTPTPIVFTDLIPCVRFPQQVIKKASSISTLSLDFEPLFEDGCLKTVDCSLEMKKVPIRRRRVSCRASLSQETTFSTPRSREENPVVCLR